MADRPTYVWTGTAWDTIADPGAVRKTTVENTGLQFADGSAAAPSVSNVGDTDTGLFFPADNEVAIATSGAERVRVDSAGRVGIGKAPGSALEVYSASSATLFIAGDSTTGETLRRSSSDTTAAGITFVKRRGTEASPAAVQNGDEIGRINFLGYDGSASNFAGVILGRVGGASGASDMPGQLEFWVTPDGSTSPSERMRIDATGRVSIRNGGVLEAPIVTNAQTTSYTLALADAGKLVEMGSGSALTLTIPADASVAFPVGTKIDVLQTGAGQVTIAGSGFTPNATPGLKISAQWGAATLVKRGTNSWVVIGNLTA